MDIRVAITHLDLHNRWRRGEFDDPPLNPKALGETIDKIIEWSLQKIKEEEQRTKK